MGRAQLKELEETGWYLSVPRGISMKPMIKDQETIVKIEKLTKPAKRYDLVMYIRPGGQGVIHRVVYVLKNHYVIVGDNCWKYEFIRKDKVKGIATSFCRNGKWYGVDNKWYLLYVHIWVDLLFLKAPLFRIRDKIKRELRKLRQ